MHNSDTVHREDIAEIYDRLADMSIDTAMNEGRPGDVDHVVKYLGVQAKWEGHAADVRATIALGNLVGNRVR